MLKRLLNASEKQIKEYVDLKIDAVNAKIDAIDMKIDTKIDAVNTRIDAVDKSVGRNFYLITSHVHSNRSCCWHSAGNHSNTK